MGTHGMSAAALNTDALKKVVAKSSLSIRCGWGHGGQCWQSPGLQGSCRFAPISPCTSDEPYSFRWGGLLLGERWNGTGSYCYWVGSLDFNLCIPLVFPFNLQKVQLFAVGSTAPEIRKSNPRQGPAIVEFGLLATERSSEPQGHGRFMALGQWALTIVS